MRVVCPQDVKKMLLKQATMACWKKWAAKHKCGVVERRSVIGAKANLRRKTNHPRTRKHRHVIRNLVVEGGWVQKRTYDVGWSDGEVSRLRHGRRHGETQAVPLSILEGSRKLDHRGIGEMGTQSWNVERALENDEEVLCRIL